MLLPASSAAKRTTGRLRSAVRAGVGAAALVVAGLGVYGHMRLREVEGSLHAAEAQAAGWREARGAAQAVAAARAASAGLLQRVREALGAGAPWRAVMRLVSEASPGVIRLTSVDLRLENGAATALLVGSVRAGDDAAFAELLKGYADALAACPIVQGVKMGATSRVDVNGVTAHRFELTVSLVSLPNDGGLASAGARP